MNYQQDMTESLTSPTNFWGHQAKRISWFRSPQKIMTLDERTTAHWYPDGELNTAFLALDHHVLSGRGEQVALLYDSPVTQQKTQFTFSQLTEAVACFAGVLVNQGVRKGDRVVIYMPMVPEAVIAMLACARIGAVHSVVFGGFAAHELAVRIDDATPTVLLTASCGIEVDRVIPYKPIVNKALAMASHQPQACIVLQRSEHGCELTPDLDHDWHEALQTAQPVDCTPVNACDPLYILYTSGTTGKPKGVVRDNGGHAVAMAYSMDAMYGMKVGDVFWAASDIGWVVGHSYIVYGPLIAGCTTVLYEGKPVRTPDSGAFWRVCAEYRVNAVFAAPTAFRAIRKEDPACHRAEQYDLSALRTVFMAGERLDPPTQAWVEDSIGKPVIDHWWQTETGWAIAGNHVGYGSVVGKPGSVCRPSPGFDVQILDDDGHAVPAGEQGHIAVRLPLPPGSLPTIWNNEARFIESYLASFPGYYVSGDGGLIDDDGYLFVQGRTDDVINVAGHRLSTGELEEVVAAHDWVAECCVIGVKSDLKGEEPLALVILKDGIQASHDELAQALNSEVRHQVGAIASLQNTFVVKRLPKTRSGKILRKILRAIVNGDSYQTPSTIDDPQCLDEIEAIFGIR